ncbi:hypothetical protein V6N12_011282 [Hibiscus sabdariffa]|uniref:non-specific serine/threonine protein kinase n=1 Tax=Hibiscus sabdariffa TaxID=183260 RepID=A0ABR2EMJ7_9ROSI
MIKSFDGNKGRWSFVGSNNKVPEHCSDQGTRIEALRNAHKRKVKHSSGLISLVSKEILEIKALNQNDGCFAEEGKIKNANIGRGRWYIMKELEMATRGFTEENVVGEGGYDVVFHGVLQDGSVVIVKSLLNNKYVNSKIYPFVIVSRYCLLLCLFAEKRQNTFWENIYPLDILFMHARSKADR